MIAKLFQQLENRQRRILDSIKKKMVKIINVGSPELIGGLIVAKRRWMETLRKEDVIRAKRINFTQRGFEPRG